MPTNTDVTTLKINTLTKAQYETAVQGGVIGANEISILTDVDEAIQVDTMPTAVAGEVGKVYQFIGTTDANYTHGYFYECVSDGGNPATYSWSQVNVQPAGSSLPSQSGNSGKFLTTDGTDPSWATISALQNTATGTQSLTILGTATAADVSINIGTNSTAQGIGCLAIGEGTQVQNTYTTFSTAIGRSAKTNNSNSTAIGAYSGADTYNVGSITTVGYYARSDASQAVVIGASANCSFRGTKSVTIGAEAGSFGDRGIAIGYKSKANANGAIQIGSNGSSNSPCLNSDPETLKIGNTNGNFELMSADGTIPEARLADTTSATQGQALVLDSNLNAIWSTVESLPSQSGQSGKYLTTNGTTASWATVETLPSQSGNSGKLLTTNGTVASWDTKANLGLSGVTLRTWGANE